MYRGFGGGNMQSLMAQAQKMQKQMQEKMAKAEEELNNAEITGSAGGGMVNVVVDGHKNVRSISIKPEVVDPEDVEMLEDLILAALNEANEKAEEMSSSLKGDGFGGLF
jgi:DNA-binding YbaB/EbfC family protein